MLENVVPFYGNDADDGVEFNPAFMVSVPQLPSTNTGENSFEFETLGVSNYLGYNHIRYPIAGTTLQKEMSYVAENVFKPVDVYDSFLVELLK